MPLQSSTVIEDFVFELWQFKQQNSVDRQTDKLSTAPSAHVGKGNDRLRTTLMLSKKLELSLFLPFEEFQH